MPVTDLHHLQLAMPPDEEESARRFYGQTLGSAEIPKPENLAARGGVWFAIGDRQLHLGVELGFRPAKKAHPALLVSGLAELEVRLRQAGVQVLRDQPLAGYDRIYVSDPFGNRLELLERLAD